MSPQRAKAEHTISDFLDWQAKFEEEKLGEPSKLDRQLARIAYYQYLVFMATCQSKDRLKGEDDFLVRYTMGEEKPKPPPTTADARSDDPPKGYNAAKVAASKAAWIGFGKAALARRLKKPNPHRKPRG